MDKSRANTNKDRKQSAAGRGKGNMATGADRNLAELLKERDNLRAELARSERRIRSLEDANREAAKRLDTAIGTVKSLIASG
ncbi:MAG: DUF4164 family protein [Hyphomicrobiales bacterium]|nr:DUF4164 family protein [Hyphomicrobiales bacterium]